MKRRALVIYREPSEIGPYRAAVEAAGIEPELVMPGAAASVGDYAGLLLTGGPDVNPALYRELPHPSTEAPDDERDAIECRLIGEALDLDLPILAICRGLQIFNVFHGGTLVQHLDTSLRHVSRTEDRSQATHDAVVEPDTLLARIVDTPVLPVNSRHHQAAARVGSQLRVSARGAEDGVVEAVERADKRFALAVQWHPEDQVFADGRQLRIFQDFARALGREGR